jgi:hypothetical protein
MSDDITQRAVDHIAGAARLIAGAQLALARGASAGSRARVIDSLCTSIPT